MLKTYGSFLNWYYIILFLKYLITEKNPKTLDKLGKVSVGEKYFRRQNQSKKLNLQLKQQQ